MRSPYGPERLCTAANETETEMGPAIVSIQEEGAELFEHNGVQDRSVKTNKLAPNWAYARIAIADHSLGPIMAQANTYQCPLERLDETLIMSTGPAVAADRPAHYQST